MHVEADGSIRDRLTLVYDQIRRALRESGRDEGEVRLVAATKSVPVERIREAIAAGLRIAGENRL